MKLISLQNDWLRLRIAPDLGASPVEFSLRSARVAACPNGAPEFLPIMRPTSEAALAAGDSARFSSYTLAPYCNRIRDGRMRFLGRDSQMLKILGELVALPPLQSRLDSFALGRADRSVLVPVEDARRGTTLVLASTDARAAGLVDEFNASVQPFERIERFVQVADLPLTDLGKVRLAELAARIA